MRIEKPQDLDSFREHGLKCLYPDHIRVGIGMATCGIACGAEAVAQGASEYLGSDGKDITLVHVGCLGLCQAEPLVDVYRPGMPRIVYGHVDADKVVEILKAARQGEEHTDGAVFKLPTEELLIENQIKQLGQDGYAGVTEYSEQSFFAKQRKIALRNCGFIDLENIEEYIARGGYYALAKALNSMERMAVVEEVTNSGLRGRGGGGFKTGWK